MLVDPNVVLLATRTYWVDEVTQRIYATHTNKDYTYGNGFSCAIVILIGKFKSFHRTLYLKDEDLWNHSATN